MGSTSWTFIEKSVKNGRLEDIEDHRAGPVTQSTRPVGSKQSTRSTRTPFTSEDDRILMNWVVKAERDGLAIRGNEIYEQLAGKVWDIRILQLRKTNHTARIIDIHPNHGATDG